MGDFGDLYVSGGMGIVLISRTVTSTSSPWATIISASLPCGVAPSAISRAALSVDEHGDFPVVAVASPGGTVAIHNRGSKTLDFGGGCQVYGQVAFPLA